MTSATLVITTLATAITMVVTLILFIQNSSIMATFEELQANLARLNEEQEQTSIALTGIADDIVRIKNSIPPAGAITQEQLDALAAELSSITDRAQYIAATA